MLYSLSPIALVLVWCFVTIKVLLLSLSLSQKSPQAFAPLEVEALAAAWALEFAVELGITHAILEGDSLMLIQALENGCVVLSPCGLLLDDVRYRSNFFDSTTLLSC